MLLNEKREREKNMSAKIKLIRVDNRLVHGQVGVTWTDSLSIDTIVVVDDEVVYNPLSQKLMQTIAKSSNVQIRFYTAEQFVETYQNSSSNRKLFVVVKTIQVVKRLCVLVLSAQKLNIGNIHYEKGRYPFNRKMYLTKEDVEDIIYLNQHGYSVFYQDVPGTLVEKLDSISLEDLKIRR